MAKRGNKAKVTIEMVKKATGYASEPAEEVVLGDGEDEVRVMIKRHLTLAERSGMVQDITNMVFRDVDGEEMYAPYLRKIAFDYNIMHYFTNLSLPADANKISDFADNTDFVRVVMGVVGEEYINGVLAEAKDLIDFKKKKLARRTRMDDFLGSLSEFTKVMSANMTDDKIGKLFGEALSKVAGELNLETVAKDSEAMIATADEDPAK